MFVLAEFLFDFPFKNFSLFCRCFGNRSKDSSTFLAFSLYQSKKEQIDRSKGQRAYLFVNGRKEEERNLLCKFVWDRTQFAILMNADHKQEKDSQHRTGE